MLKIIASGSVCVPKWKSGGKSAGKPMKSLLYALACRECRGYQSHAQVRAARIMRASPSLMGVTNQALPSGYQLLNYRIDRQISRGGVSIVYRAVDGRGGPVGIKGYLP